MSSVDPKLNLIWIDLEMTGLSPESDSILEIATLVTDAQLNLIAEGPVFAIAHSLPTLEAMDNWNRSHHSASGLWQQVLQSTTGHAHAERATLDFLAQHVAAGASPMCGNTICQDRRFLARQMPELERFFHYRNVDVSTLKELARRWTPKILSGFEKVGAHTALADIRESVAELQYYRKQLFNAAAQQD